MYGVVNKQLFNNYVVPGKVHGIPASFDIPIGGRIKSLNHEFYCDCVTSCSFFLNADYATIVLRLPIR